MKAHLTDGERSCITSRQKQELEVARSRKNEKNREQEQDETGRMHKKKSERSKWPRNTSYNNTHTTEKEKHWVR